MFHTRCYQQIVKKQEGDTSLVFEEQHSEESEGKGEARVIVFNKRNIIQYHVITHNNNKKESGVNVCLCTIQ